DHSGADYANQLFMDALIHGWDIATATGQDTRLQPDLVQACMPVAEDMTRRFRSARVFGEGLPVSPGASPQTRLLATLGRRHVAVNISRDARRAPPPPPPPPPP